MAFNDDLSKFVHSYPYTNYHELVLDFLTNLLQELKKIVDDADLIHLPEKLEAINALLDANSTKIRELESASASASEAIRDLRAITIQHTVDLEQIHDEIDGVIGQLTDAVAELEDDIDALEAELDAFKISTNASIDALNQVAFDPSQIVMSNMPFNFGILMLDAYKRGVRIVSDESVTTTDSIQWVDAGDYMPYGLPIKQQFTRKFKIPRFYSSGNMCHLVIPSVFPIKYGASINWNLYFYANRYIGTTSTNTGISKVGSISFTDLLAEGGYSKTGATDSGSVCFNEMELFANTNTGCYDLHIYNGRNGHYTWINDYMFSSLMILPIDLGTMTQPASIQRYFNLLNTFAVQSTADVDGKINNCLAESKYYTDVTEYGIYSSITPTSLTFTPASGVTIVRDNSYSETFIYDTRTVHKIYIELSVDVANLAHNTDTVIGSFDTPTLESNHNVNCDIQKPNLGCYAQLSNAGSIALHAYNTSNESFGDSSRVHIMGVVIQTTYDE